MNWDTSTLQTGTTKTRRKVNVLGGGKGRGVCQGCMLTNTHTYTQTYAYTYDEHTQRPFIQSVHRQHTHNIPKIQNTKHKWYITTHITRTHTHSPRHQDTKDTKDIIHTDRRRTHTNIDIDYIYTHSKRRKRQHKGEKGKTMKGESIKRKGISTKGNDGCV